MDEINNNTAIFVAHLQRKLVLLPPKAAHVAKELIERFLPIKRLLKDFHTNNNAIVLCCSPSPLIDAAWHELVLFTDFYAMVCGKRFIHYNPMAEMDPINVKAERYSKTLDAYEELFGVRPDDSDVWPAVYPGLIPLQMRRDNDNGRSLMTTMEVEKEELPQLPSASAPTVLLFADNNKAIVNDASFTSPITANLASNNNNTVRPAGLNGGDIIVENVEASDGSKEATKEAHQLQQPASLTITMANNNKASDVDDASLTVTTTKTSNDRNILSKVVVVCCCPDGPSNKGDTKNDSMDGNKEKRDKEQQQQQQQPAPTVSVVDNKASVNASNVTITTATTTAGDVVSNESNVMANDATDNNNNKEKKMDKEPATTTTTIVDQANDVSASVNARAGVVLTPSDASDGKRKRSSTTVAGSLSDDDDDGNDDGVKPKKYRKWTSRTEVLTATGEIFVVVMKSSDRIKKIKATIQDEEGIHPGHQRLYFNGKQLEDHRTLPNYGISRNWTIFLQVTHTDGFEHLQVFQANIKLFVKSAATGKTYTLEVVPSYTIEQVKTQLFCKEGIPPNHQELKYESKTLEDSCTLAAYDIQNGATLSLRDDMGCHIREKGKLRTPSTRRLQWIGKIDVHTSTCHVFRVNVKSTDTIGKVKTIIQGWQGLHPDHQCFYVRGMQLKDALTLDDYGIPQDLLPIYLEIITHTSTDDDVDDLLQQNGQALKTNNKIFVKTSTGGMITLGFMPSQTVDRVKTQLWCKEGYPPDNQRLIYGGTQLENGRALSDYGITNEATLLLRT